jgi:hypothetical protein
MAANRLVAPVQDVAPPFADEDAFGRATLIAGVVVDGAVSLCRPEDDLDGSRCRFVDQPDVAFVRRRLRRHDRHRDVCKTCGEARIEVVDHRGVQRPRASRLAFATARR